MKKIKLFALFLFFALGLGAIAGCSSSNVPTYKGMTISKTIRTSSIKYLNEGETPEITEDDLIEEEVEKDIEELEDLVLPTDEEVKYYVNKGETFIVEIHLDNPKDYEIQSFTLNGKKYANYMFKEGSTMELLLLEVVAPMTSGYTEYTIDAIKYIDGTEIKDVRMNGDKTIKAGIKYNYEPTINVINTTINATSINLDFSINDKENIIGENEIVAYLSNGEEVINKKNITKDITTLTFDNLDMGTTYQYGIFTSYDLIDGEELQERCLVKNTFTTLKSYNFKDLIIDKESVEFDFEVFGDESEINYIAIFDKDLDNTLVQTLEDNSLRKFDNLLSNHNYIIKVEFTYTSNNETKTESDVIEFTTLAKELPQVAFENVVTTENSIDFDLNVIDNDEVGYLSKVTLFKDKEIVKEFTLEELSNMTFDNLETYKNYTILVEYNYDLNDGKGEQVLEVIEEVTTNPHVSLKSCRILNNSAVQEGDSVFLEMEVNNPNKTTISQVVINGVIYEVNLASSNSKIRVEIPITSDFEGGETAFVIEHLYANIDGKEYSYRFTENNTSSIMIYGKFEIKNIEIVDKDLNPIEHTSDPNNIYAYFTLNNDTGYTINSINGVDVSLKQEFRMIDNNHFVYKSDSTDYNTIWGFGYGWNTLTIDEVSYSIDSLSKKTSYSGDKPFIYYTIGEKEISKPEDLLNMNEGYYYKLVNDIDLSGYEWVHEENIFKGIFDGNGYSIKNMGAIGSYTDRDLNLGLFTSGAGVIQNLNLKNVVYIITFNRTNDNFYRFNYGGLCAIAVDRLSIYNCSVDSDSSISLTNNVDGITAGGLVGIGYVKNISNSYNQSSIYVKSLNGAVSIGGIFGKKYDSNISIKNCYNSGNIVADALWDSIVCGILAGGSINDKIENCVNMGQLECSSKTNKTPCSGIAIPSEWWDERIVMDIANSYTLDKYADYDVTCTIEQLNSKEFYTDTLGWDELIWNLDNLDVENGIYPTLK